MSGHSTNPPEAVTCWALAMLVETMPMNGMITTAQLTSSTMPLTTRMGRCVQTLATTGRVGSVEGVGWPTPPVAVRSRVMTRVLRSASRQAGSPLKMTLKFSKPTHGLRRSGTNGSYSWNAIRLPNRGR